MPFENSALFWVLIVLTAVMAIVLGVTAVIFVSYRKQIKKTCSQLEFMTEMQTNMRITGKLPFAELEVLIDRLNKLVDASNSLARRAKKSEDGIKQVVTSLSHDIRTPLTSLNGYFQLLQESESEEDRLRYASVIEGRIESLKSMLDQLFTFAKLQDSQYTIKLESVDFFKVAVDTALGYYEAFKDGGVEADVDFCDTGAKVLGNKEAIERIVGNIIKNALEHGGVKEQPSDDRLSDDRLSEARPAVTMESGFLPSPTEPAEESGAERAFFRCKNTVNNPEAIDATRVFDRFYRVDEARGGGSSGLGLWIAKSLAERMGGSVEISMEEDVFCAEVVMPVQS